MLYAIIGVLANGLLLSVSASDIEMWVGVICSCVITVITCIIEVVNLIKSAKNNSEDAPEDEASSGDASEDEELPENTEGDDGKK